jgi:hypothetical protein
MYVFFAPVCVVFVAFVQVRLHFGSVDSAGRSSQIREEVWESWGRYISCDMSGEDPNCSDSNLIDLSIPDHLTYLGEICGFCL